MRQRLDRGGARTRLARRFVEIVGDTTPGKNGNDAANTPERPVPPGSRMRSGLQQAAGQRTG